MRVPHGLAGLRAGVEHHPVAVAVDPGLDGDLMGLGRDLVQQSAAGLRHRGEIRQVRTGYYQDMEGRLRIYVAERNGALALHHPVGRQVSRNDLAKQAVWHDQILTCRGIGGPPTYMVTVLRTHDAPPLWCAGLFGLPSPRVRRKAGGSGDAIQKWTGMGGKCERW